MLFTLAIGMPKVECLDPWEITVNFPITNIGHSSVNGNHFPLSREINATNSPAGTETFFPLFRTSLLASVASDRYSLWNADSLFSARVWNPHC
jgi:hypothetical protein